MIDRSSVTTPVLYAGQVVGVLQTTVGTGAKRFQLVATDMVGSALGDTDGTARIPSPFGERAAQPDVAAAVDYTAKGWDADLGVVRMGVRDYDPLLRDSSRPTRFSSSTRKPASRAPTSAISTHTRRTGRICTPIRRVSAWTVVCWRALASAST